MNKSNKKILFSIVLFSIVLLLTLIVYVGRPFSNNQENSNSQTLSFNNLTEPEKEEISERKDKVISTTKNLLGEESTNNSRDFIESEIIISFYDASY